MKKLFFLLLAVFGLLLVFYLEGDSLVLFFSLVPATAVFPLLFGVLFTTMFSFRLKEIGNTFKNAFSEQSNSNFLRDYYKNLSVVKNLQSSTTFWSGSIVILAIVQTLSHLTTLNKLGHSLAIAFSALFLGFVLKAALFIPMEHSLNKKIFLVENK